MHVNVPYISTNVSIPCAAWKVIKYEVLFWNSSGFFFIKCNMLCKLNRFEYLIWSSILFSTERSFHCWEKKAVIYLTWENKIRLQIFSEDISSFRYNFLIFIFIAFFYDCYDTCQKKKSNNEINEIRLIEFTLFFYFFIFSPDHLPGTVSKNSLIEFIKEGVECLYN